VARRFINRVTEFSALSACWARAVAGSGNFIVIEGEAGSGKSRLLSEARKDAQKTGAWLATGLCLPYAAAPFGPISDVLRLIARDHPAAFPPAPHLREVLRGLVPELRGPFESTGAADQLKSRWMLEGAVETLRRLSATTPAAIAIEDLHWADNGTLDFLRFVVPQLTDLRIAIVATVRDDEIAGNPVLSAFMGEIVRQPNTTRIRLADLSMEDSRRLVAAAMPEKSSVSAETIARICAIGEGHPLFIEELLKHSLERPAADSPEALLPTSIDRALASRLAGIDAQERRVLEVAAAIGSAFSLDELCEVAAISREHVMQALKNAKDRNLVIEQRDSRFRFRHELMRQAVYTNALATSLRPIHLALAQRLEQQEGGSAATLAYHYAAAGQTVKAADFAERAGDESIEAFSFSDAVAHFERALGSAADSRHAAELELKIGRSFSLLGDNKRAIAAFDRALDASEKAGDSNLRLRALFIAFRSASRDRLNPERPFRLATEALALADEAGTAGDLLLAHVQLAQELLARRALDEARTHLDATPSDIEGLPLQAQSFQEEVRARTEFASGRLSQFRTAFAKAAELARAARSVDNECNAHFNWGVLELELGAFDSALREFETIHTIAGKYGLQRFDWLARLETVEVLIFRGELARAKAIFEEIDPALNDAAWRTVLAYLGMWLAELLGDAALQERFADEELLAQARATEDPEFFGPLAGAHARMIAQKLGAGDAFPLLAEAVGMMRDANCNQQTLITVAMLGFAGALPRARELLTKQKAVYRSDRANFTLDAFDGFAALHDNKRSDAKRIGIAARAVAEKMGAATLVDYADRIIAGDASPPRKDSRGAPLLSARESEVAQLVSAGLTNREIALKLTISERTAEQHVSAVLRKYGLRSRTELALKLGARPDPQDP
jgi:DNA-binding CsgD family transcriptional regulator/tetratricopeptide (TPR) repeat protein